MSSGSHASITGFESPKDLSLDLSSGSSVQRDFEVGDISIDLASGSEMTLTGTGGDATINASSRSEVDLSQFAMLNVKVDASRESTITVNASGILDVDSSSGSKVYYLGDPTLGEIDSSSGSSVKPK